MINRAYIIDDDDISVFLTSMMLESHLFARTIESYVNVEDALYQLQHIPDENLPDVILLDLNMPVLNGWDFLETISQQESRFLGRCHVFILTSSVDPLEKQQATQYKLVNGFLRKPLDESSLAFITKAV
ncbi:response regulator [Pontibacter sp. H259]|uniref:response regulator n=1 Tax=Pontibacter sp. H259 TaxID=3133421 RepID=UPI0030BBA041